MLADKRQHHARQTGLGSSPTALKIRLLSWWRGVGPGQADPGYEAQTEFSADQDELSGQPWSTDRIAAIEAVWGDGFMLPGGERFARKLLAVLNLSPKNSVLEVGAGLGGTARTLSRQHNLWLEAIEPVAQVAVAGQRCSAAAGLARRAPIDSIDLDTFELKPRRYHAIYSREWMFTVANKDRVLDQIAAGLKPNGEVLLTDLVVSAPETRLAGDRNILRPGERAHFWTADRYSGALRQRGFLVHHALDLTTEYLDHIHAAWSKMPQTVETLDLSPHLREFVVEEGEVWLNRWNALEKGDLAVMRFHARLVEAD